MFEQVQLLLREQDQYCVFIVWYTMLIARITTCFQHIDALTLNYSTSLLLDMENRI